MCKTFPASAPPPSSWDRLAVKAKGDVIVISMFLGKSAPEKIALAKAVAQKLIAHY